MKTVGIAGHFGLGKNYLDGQTIKIKIVAEELKNTFGEIDVFDSCEWKDHIVRKLCSMPGFVKKNENIVIMPAHNGLKVFAPLFGTLCKIYKRRLFYVVIGGWLPEYLGKHRWLIRILKEFNGIFVETASMKDSLCKSGFKNVQIMPNCKKLDILSRQELVFSGGEPYRFCTFSRVMKEKGIEDAINAVKEINHRYNRVVCTLDIYGQVDAFYKQRFYGLQKNFPEFVKYRGMVDFDKSTAVLKSYYVLLFPTYYSGEGFAGTIIDAFSAGLPVIASNWRYNCEIVTHLKTGLIYPCGDCTSLAAAMEWVMNNREITEAMKINCINEAKKYTTHNAVEVLKESIMNGMMS